MARILRVPRLFDLYQCVTITLPVLFLQCSTLWLATSASDGFIINLGAFNGSNMRCSTGVGSSGILQITPNADIPPYVAAGRCLYNETIKLLDSTGAHVSSFSTTFTFSMYNADKAQNGPGGTSALLGFAFLMVAEPRPEFGYDTSVPAPCCPEPLEYLGVLNETSNGKNSSHTFAVEFDVYDSSTDLMFDDPPYDHVGINLNSMNSSFLARAGSYHRKLSCTRVEPVPAFKFVPMNLSDGRMIQAWIEYEGQKKQLNVSISSQLGIKPSVPLLKTTIDLASIVQERMYVGFSSAGNADGEKTPSLIYAWSFNVGESASPLYPESPIPGCNAVLSFSNFSRASLSNVYVSIISSLVLLLCVFFLVGFSLTKQKRALRKEFQLLELENLEYGPIKYTYRALRAATQGFDTSQSLGSGGLGMFYKAVLGASGREVAVKRIPRTSKANEREFVAEVRIIGRLRHRNLVQLQGWCYHKQDLLLVYELLPHGSLDHFLFKNDAKILAWGQRLHILKGVATALVYLHEECELEKPLVHRNVRASNVMLDSEFNARLGDFGLERFCEQNRQGVDSTMAAGTKGRYLSPHANTSTKFTEKSDVHSFGVLALQVASGRRPMEPAAQPLEDKGLIKWTRGLYRNKRLLDAVDRRLGNDYSGDEVVTVLQVGLLCSHPDPRQRPSMRRVKQMLCGESAIPPFPTSISRLTAASGLLEWDDPLTESYTTPEISLIDSPEIGLIASFKDSMGDRASSRDSMGKRSRSYGS